MTSSNSPQLVAFYEGAEYDRMARVLAYSAAEHCHGWDLRIEAATLFRPDEATVEQRVRLGNAKLLHWCQAVEQAPDGRPMLLIDCDCLIRRSLDDVWLQPFDVAYTARDPKRTKLPLNAGIVFVRATPAARKFLRAWLKATEPYRASMAGQSAARRMYGAADQAGLVKTLSSKAADGVQILALPCREWNCEDSEWGRFDPAVTRIVHIKGALRRAVFGQGVSPQRDKQVRPLAQQWKACERGAHA